MNSYDADVAPEATAWLELEPSERTQLILRAHAGCAGDSLHTKDMNEILHCSLHSVIENQIASAKPAAVGLAMAKMQLAGLKRHAALHAVMQELAARMAALSDGKKFDMEGYTAALNGLDAATVVAGALQRAPAAPSAEEPMNRAQRRAQRKQKKR